MPISFDKVLGVHDNALLVFERRNQLLTENIVNADTPNYKARDIDFDTILNGHTNTSLSMTRSDDQHIAQSGSEDVADVLYRQPLQSSADGNTVDSQQEKAAFAENSVRYQTTLTVLSRRFSGMISAFRGE